MVKYLMLNGEILPTAKPCLSHNNRGLLYADTFSFKLRGNSSKAFFIDYYFDYLIATLKLLRMERPVLLKKSVFETDLELLLQKNRIYKGFTSTVTVFRNCSDAKLAIDNTVSIMIVVDEAESEYYSTNSNGLKAGFLKNYYLPDSLFKFNFTPQFSAELLLASKLSEAECDEFLIADINGNIVKSVHSSVFFAKDGNLIVPELTPADSDRIFAALVVLAAESINIPIITQRVRKEDLAALDEVFFADVCNGICRVMAYGEKRYFNKISPMILKRINDMLIPGKS